ncbi:sensor domain-containing diguanylate cyclase [Polymorphobacter fuscus]|uniref:sensor domain-containing diguanylate cyclase n=1 Tax=Sandarakinorhabdus fusca TaxID=1439888 RepID=UPI001295872A|nr:sensor domain-containing diguanylate cyclase [Polymorphobacter fuscus]NJC09623.1 diguanylate cyclase (GGDEF)-like protein [Polymorphobacter fuscus]
MEKRTVDYVTRVKELAAEAVTSSIFQRALDALPDGVLLVNAERRMVYANTAFTRLWQMPDDILASKDDARALQYVTDQLVDPEQFRLEVERLHATTETSEDEILFKDGRIISRRSLPFEEGVDLAARIWIFTDITEARSASVDHLTGLPNRLAFSRAFPHFVTAPADGLTRSIAMLDVDNFKRYNDLYGHACGDDVLDEIGTIFQAHGQETGDLAFRIGGEEFLMATRTRNSSEARILFEKLRKSICALNIVHEGNRPHQCVTVSIGFASFQGAAEPQAIFETVDKALYLAKDSGRNRIVEATV